ncbi:GNAT family N-acetyltransferase [Rhodoferax sp.]|uniref:GNAT family N-acetyltransferase n=1 Tax=Rhodoferax sp. TaxID=50421 RepID=UPI0019E9DCDB|nr:GNAT family N-acetyltransferase [Rhodoferax sp.]MBE0473523.1 N-acetyltransferase [Rhodoferax sp.]
MINSKTTDTENDYVIRVLDSPADVDASAWDALLFKQRQATPFMRHAYLNALHASGSASPDTGWTPRFFLLECQGELCAAGVLYLKTHSHGEYVFDWAWANAYAEHGLAYYPKALCAVPFTPVPGARLLARSQAGREQLAALMLNWCQHQQLSGLHSLFAADEDLAAFKASGLLLRHTVQFHWHNSAPGYADFDAFLTQLTAEKRKKIRQERRKVADTGVSFRIREGRQISAGDWDFFYQCYERTYLEHGNAPYLNRDFFSRMANTMPEDWLLFIAERGGRAIAASLIALNASCVAAASRANTHAVDRVAYGRYWGALERVDCLHFEACYYQPLQWCIANGYQRFEGGAQGEHKLARALLPVTTSSAHWLAQPQFMAAVGRYLSAEREGIQGYVADLAQHSPLKSELRAAPCAASEARAPAHPS